MNSGQSNGATNDANGASLFHDLNRLNHQTLQIRIKETIILILENQCVISSEANFSFAEISVNCLENKSIFTSGIQNVT